MLMSDTPTKIDIGDKNGIVPQKVMSSFFEMMFAKSKDLIGNFNGGIFAVNEMSAAAIGHAFTLTNLFVCLEQTLSKELLGYEDLSDFPIQTFFLRDCAEFDQSLKDGECLGGTLSYLEQEMKESLAHFKKIKIEPNQARMLKHVQMLINMFNYGLLDQIGNYQSVLEKIYIKHRALDDLDMKYPQN